MGNALEGLLAFTAGGVSKAAKQVRENELLEIDRKNQEQDRRTKRISEISQSLITLFGTGQFDPESLKFAMSQVSGLVANQEGAAAFELLQPREKVESPKDVALTAFREQQTQTSKSREDFNKAKTAKLGKDETLNEIKAGLTSTNAEIDDTRQKIAGLNVTLKDFRLRTNDLNKLAFASDEKLDATDQTKDDRKQARLDLKQIKQDEAQVKFDIKKLERSLTAVSSQRDALQGKLDIPETPESKELERVLKTERDAKRQFEKISRNTTISGKLRVIRKLVTRGDISLEKAVDQFVRLFTETLQRGLISQQEMEALAEEFVETL